MVALLYPSDLVWPCCPVEGVWFWLRSKLLPRVAMPNTVFWKLHQNKCGSTEKHPSQKCWHWFKYSLRRKICNITLSLSQWINSLLVTVLQFYFGFNDFNFHPLDPVSVKSTTEITFADVRSQTLGRMDCVTIHIAIFLSSASWVKQDAKGVGRPRFRNVCVCDAF